MEVAGALVHVLMFLGREVSHFCCGNHLSALGSVEGAPEPRVPKHFGCPALSVHSHVLGCRLVHEDWTRDRFQNDNNNRYSLRAACVPGSGLSELIVQCSQQPFEVSSVL